MVGDNRINVTNSAIYATPVKDGHRDVASRTDSYCCSQTIRMPLFDSRTTIPTSLIHWIRERSTSHRPRGVTTAAQDRYIRVTHLRNRLMPATPTVHQVHGPRGPVSTDTVCCRPRVTTAAQDRYVHPGYPP